MAKGFGGLQQGDLGYVLLVLPEVKAYAANVSLGEGEKEYIGITHELEDAQIWRKKNEVEEASIKYAEFLLNQSEDKKDYQKVNFSLQSLKHLENGKLKTKLENHLIVESSLETSSKNKQEIAINLANES